MASPHWSLCVLFLFRFSNKHSFIKKTIQRECYYRFGSDILTSNSLISYLFNSTAIFEPTSALFLTNAILATRLVPSVNSLTRLNKNGVTFLPVI